MEPLSHHVPVMAQFREPCCSAQIRDEGCLCGFVAIACRLAIVKTSLFPQADFAGLIPSWKPDSFRLDDHTSTIQPTLPEVGLLSEIQSPPRLYALNVMMRPQTNRTPSKTMSTVALVSAALG